MAELCDRTTRREQGPALTVNRARGRLRLGGHDYLLIRPETLAPLCRSPDPTVHALLEEGGRRGGECAAEGVLAAGFAGREALLELCATGGRIGWGRFRLVTWEPGRVVVEVDHSPFARGIDRKTSTTCHLIRGVLAGMVSRILSRPAEGRETACAAGGAARCRFEVATEPTAEAGL